MSAPEINSPEMYRLLDLKRFEAPKSEVESAKEKTRLRQRRVDINPRPRDMVMDLRNFRAAYPKYEDWSNEKILRSVRHKLPQHRDWDDAKLARSLEYKFQPQKKQSLPVLERDLINFRSKKDKVRDKIENTTDPDKLKQLDPEFYTIVDKSNHKRLMRAIEVCITTGKTYSSLRVNKIKPRDFDIIKIGLNRDRSELFDRINNRVDIMINNGLVEEARNLFPFHELNALNTVGYKELFEYFENKVSLEQAITNTKTNTRRYAKRQLTWFKKDESIKWFHPNEIVKIVQVIR